MHCVSKVEICEQYVWELSSYLKDVPKERWKDSILTIQSCSTVIYEAFLRLGEDKFKGNLKCSQIE